MSAFLKRFILSAVALPAVYALCMVVTGYHHLALVAAIVVVMGAGGFETAGLLRRSGLPVSRWLLPVAAGLLPVVVYLEVAGLAPGWSFEGWLLALMASSFVGIIYVGETREVTEILPRLSAWMLQIIYPAFFASFLVRFAGLSDAPYHYLLFFCMVFGNDTAAYAAGKLAGPSTALHLRVSPAKTAVGFAFGMAVSVGFPLLFGRLRPGVFHVPAWTLGLFGAIVGLAAILGDLVESAFKRSAGVKDSGRLMLGRGGVLDTVDSMLISAPIYYLGIRLLIQ